MFELEMSLNIIAEGYEKAWPLYLYFMEMTSDLGQCICMAEINSELRIANGIGEFATVIEISKRIRPLF